MISVENGIKLAKDILEFGNLELLAVEAADILTRYNNNIPLSTKERFIIGLAYSEFYTEDTSDAGYYRAEIKRQNFLKALGINGFEFVQKLESLL